MSEKPPRNPPEKKAPEQSQPEQSQPEQSQPEQSQPEQSQPEQIQPEQIQPEQIQPEPDPSIVPELYTGELEALARHPVGQKTEENRRKLARGPSQKPHPEATPIVQVEGVHLAFDEPILEDVSFQANEGETVVVVGESGTGKSTILKLLLRLLVPDKGQVLIDGENIVDLSFDEALEVRQKMGMVFQSAALFDSLTVFENVAYPLREHTELNDEEIDARVREKLEFVDLEPDKVMPQMPAELSGGMRKRVGIARGMANNAKIMLYDEPTSGLDPLTTATITHLIMKLQKELNVTSIVVSHDIRSSFRMGTKVALLAERRIVYFGTPEEMRKQDDEYIRKFLGGY